MGETHLPHGPQYGIGNIGLATTVGTHDGSNGLEKLKTVRSIKDLNPIISIRFNLIAPVLARAVIRYIPGRAPAS